jgi:photosystem II stability/assembly factor-like uncharacterized protein
MDKASYTVAGVVLLAVFVGFLGWFFWASYIGHTKVVTVQERMLTVHDDLLAIDGRHDGNKVAVGKFGLIFLSKNGKSWQQTPSGTNKTLSAVSFADHQHGFVVGSAGTVLATDDGGMTWRAQNSTTKDQLLGIHALSPLHVFAVGAFGSLISTSDGGRIWSKHELKWDSLIQRIVTEGGYVEPNLNAVYFSSPENGWVVGEFGLVLHTQDGGKTWNSQRYGLDFPQLYAVQFRDDRQGWAIGQNGNLIRTTNGGQRWSAVEIPTSRDLYDASIERERGVIVGDGVVLISLDGGSSWKSPRSQPEDQWLSGVVLKSTEAIAVGRAGTIQLFTLGNVASESGRKTQ